MSILATRLTDWLEGLQPGEDVYIDETHTLLRASSAIDEYIEVGGEATKSWTYHVTVTAREPLNGAVPGAAIIIIDSGLAERILDMRKAVISGNLYCAEAWDTTPDFFERGEASEAPDDWLEYEGSTEAVRLRVTNTSFMWTALLKHTDVELETEELLISSLEE